MWKQEIQQLRKRSKFHSDQKDLVAFYGSSSIRMWYEMADDLHPYQVVNLGFGGSSYRWCNHFFQEVFEFITPSCIMLYAGDNDLGSDTPESEIVENLKSLLAQIAEKYGKIPVNVISVKPSPNRLYLKENIERLNNKLQQLSREVSYLEYIDIYHPMLDSSKDVRPECYLDDMLHMNRMGYAIWTEVVMEYLDTNTQLKRH